MSKKAQFSSAFNKLQGEFHFSIDSSGFAKSVYAST